MQSYSATSGGKSQAVHGRKLALVIPEIGHLAVARRIYYKGRIPSAWASKLIGANLYPVTGGKRFKRCSQGKLQ